MFKKWIHSFLLFSAFAAVTNVDAKDCSTQFFNGKAPVATTTHFNERTTSLCFEEYALMYSGVTKTPLWTAEFLTNNRIKEARKLKRQDSFHEEEQIPNADRSYLKDYKGSTKNVDIDHSIDRGHMSPNSDFSPYTAQFESFSLANIIPQNSDNNQNLHEGIESATRKLATQRERLYVITGPIFDTTANKLNGRVVIPTRIFKAIVDPSRHEAAAYLTYNKPGMDYQVVSIAELERIVGFDLFPDLPSSIKNSTMQLPEPTPYKQHSGKDRSEQYHSKHASNEQTSFSSTPLRNFGKSLQYLFK
ncbi:DNA/RNA non-specific endonuclease [Undibacterium sp. RTI2.1]|uniref:DNA/RNA non-specific endonuclease n=1 Tax=unclassified Undibacterium TaxID=2630295 RepID=UPI002B22A5EE|nr:MULTISPECIES: DNA/RNA non-specific endonuclease [unclassified Undibacterium]MEB0032676.1 DNA/RNA non-specific endonuclease [Undibacterium sp. RTI2.1]MEB0118684.1 DNA/RNA non-specific endonuclease [Undibacterium sp. RTI2.2]